MCSNSTCGKFTFSKLIIFKCSAVIFVCTFSRAVNRRFSPTSSTFLYKSRDTTCGRNIVTPDSAAWSAILSMTYSMYWWAFVLAASASARFIRISFNFSVLWVSTSIEVISLSSHLRRDDLFSVLLQKFTSARVSLTIAGMLHPKNEFITLPFCRDKNIWIFEYLKHRPQLRCLNGRVIQLHKWITNTVHFDLWISSAHQCYRNWPRKKNVKSFERVERRRKVESSQWKVEVYQFRPSFSSDTPPLICKVRTTRCKRPTLK